MEAEMTTLGLLWSTSWRGAAWLSLAGAALGSAYGVGLLLVTTFFSTGRSAGDLPAICGVVLVVALIGGAIGGALGLVVGLFDGLVIGVVARMEFRKGT